MKNDKEEKQPTPPLSEEEGKKLCSVSVLARVRWRYRPDSFVIAPAEVKAGDHLLVTSEELGKEVVSVVKTAPLSLELTTSESFIDSFDREARLATAEEISTFEDNKKLESEIFKRTQLESDKASLNMKVLGAYVSLAKTKVFIIYTADGRVDFRNLLRILNFAFMIHIEFRQLFPRDAAKLIGGIGVCGLPICCRTFLTSFSSITINLARNQLLPLSIPKISGQCGRLMCCLSYENALYTELRTKFPKIGAVAKVGSRLFKVVSLNVLTDMIVSTDGHEYQNYTAEEWSKLPVASKVDFNAQNEMERR